MKPIRSATILRGYAWWLLKNNLDWTTDDYNGAVPIVPWSDEPKFQVQDKPYIVYGYTEQVPRHDHRITEGMLNFTVRSRRLSDINLVTRVLVEGFKREDLSAKDINQFTTDVDDYYSGITFTCTKVPFIHPGSAENSDEGRITGGVTLEYYYVDHFGDDENEDGVKLRESTFSL